MSILTIQRIYSKNSIDGGRKVLVDRLWPRGIRKDAVTCWAQEITPSRELHQWYKDNPADFVGFRSRYRKELEMNPATGPFIKEVAQWLREGPVVFVFARKEEKENNASVLREYVLETLIKERPTHGSSGGNHH
jgi:uncharacterized protein YeaO (DUF488 family)